MFVKDTAITLTCVLAPTPGTYIETDFDLEVTLPDKSVVYDEDLTSVSYVAPTSTTEGSIVFSYTPTVAGLHELVIATGTSLVHTNHVKTLLNVIEATTVKTIRATLP